LYLLIKLLINIERTVDLCVITKKEYTCVHRNFESYELQGILMLACANALHNVGVAFSGAMGGACWEVTAYTLLLFLPETVLHKAVGVLSYV